MPKIIHFRENCIGCNSCVEHAPEYWEIKDDGKAMLKKSTEKNGIYIQDIFDFEEDCNICAAKDCPVGIIRILDNSGKEKWG